MPRNSSLGLLRALACACVALALAASVAQGAELHPHVGRLPGFPAIRGVMPVLGSKAAVVAHEKVVDDAFAAVRARSSKGPSALAERNEKLFAPCEGEESFFTTRDACYRGGPVLRDPTVHLIFWQGPVEEDISKVANVSLFPGHYIETVKRYFEDVAHDSGTQTNVFAVDGQYFDRNAKGEAVPGKYALAFQGATGLVVDNSSFPKHTNTECPDENEYAKGPCLLDSDIQKEVQKYAGTEKGLGDVYLVITPPGVDGCFEGACAYQQYCAYHGDFGGNGVTPGAQTLYVDLPFVGPNPLAPGVASGCESGVHPASLVDDGADGLIDDASHELNEVITDPIGSQCETGAISFERCERNAWTDVVGQEIEDKCLPPQSTVAGAYGEPLGGSGAFAYNQLINGDRYYTQRVWSNEAGIFEGGCVQRVIGASFSVSGGAAATVPVTFDGSSSGASGDPAVYWVWDFEGEQIGTPKPTTSYAFAQPGQHVVTLTAYDSYGNGQATAATVNVGAAQPSPPSLLTPLRLPITIREPAAIAHFTSAQIATRLGLPANGRKLAARRALALGHGECPPACAVVVRLFAKQSVTSHGKRSVKLLSIGVLRLTIAVKGSSALNLTLDSRGRTLLRKSRTLPCQLQVAVEGQEGATWQIVRSLTLTR